MQFDIILFFPPDCILGFDGTLLSHGLNYDPESHEYQEYLFELPSEFDESVVNDALSKIGMTFNKNIQNQIKHIFAFD